MIIMMMSKTSRRLRVEDCAVEKGGDLVRGGVLQLGRLLQLDQDHRVRQDPADQLNKVNMI